jgi:hypothetical protein
VRCGAGPGAQAKAGQKQAKTGRGVPASVNCIIGESRSVGGLRGERRGEESRGERGEGEARSEWSGCDRRQAHSTAQHSTAQHSTAQHSSHNTAAQAQAHRMDESFIHQILFCMPRAHSRNSRRRAEQSRSPFHAPAPEGISCITPHRQLPDGGPFAGRPKHLADDRPGQQRSSAGHDTEYERG